MQWNCRGARINLAEMQILMQHYQPSIICLQETYITDINHSVNRDYYNNHKIAINTNGRRQGGVSILVRTNIPHSSLTLATTIQAVAVRVTLHRIITICSIYLPPNTAINIQELDDLLNQLPLPVILMGDFNAHSPLWGCKDLNSRGRVIEDFINNNNLCLLNEGISTYLHPASGARTAIDITLCSPLLATDFIWSVHDDLCGSDHYPVILKNDKPLASQTVKKWKLSKADWNTYNEMCKHQLNLDSNIENITKFSDTLTSIAQKTIPQTSGKPKRISKPWFDADCKSAIKSRKAAVEEFNRSPTTDNLNKIKITRAQARRTIRLSKRSSWQNYVSTLDSKTNVKQIWDMIRKIRGKFSHSCIKHLSVNNTTITDIHDITNALGEAFSSISSTDAYTATFQQYKINQEKIELNFHSNNSEYYNKYFSLSELIQAIKVSKDTAPGPDSIHYQFLKHLPEPSLQLFLLLLNRIWTGDPFPDSWLESTVIPLLKPGKEAINPRSYRPITLTSCLCKTFERMINSRLTYYLEKNHILTRYQCGFRSERSTTDHLLRLETFVRDGFMKGEHVVAVFFDLEKAYDTTWKYGILQDLHSIGLRGRMPLFISNFLAKRKFRVRVGNTLSDFHEQENGVPQGSVLSVTLFGLKINNIVNCVTRGTEPTVFVDDFMACYRSRQMRTIERQLQRTLNNLQTWADSNGFRFSETKTVCIHFCNKHKTHQDPTLYLNNSLIPVVRETKFLGMIFDNKLSFIPHLKNLRKNCSKSLNLLRAVAHKDWGANTETLLTLYRSLVRSKLDYGCMIYGFARKSYTQMLDPVQNQALRICLGAFRTSPVESLAVEANELPLGLRRQKLSVQYALKLYSNADNPAFDCCFHPDNSDLYRNRQNVIPPFGIRVQNIIHNMNIDVTLISNKPFITISPWQLKNIKINLTLHSESKRNVNPNIFKMKFSEILQQLNDYICIYTDGSKIDDKVSAAAVCMDVVRCKRLHGAASIFTAELTAISLALEIIDHSHYAKFLIASDSLSSIQAIQNSRWDNPFVCDILNKSTELLKEKDIILCWVPSHCGISGNEAADKAAKEALSNDITPMQIPYKDFYRHVTIYIKSQWQNLWNQQTRNFNKLLPIKPVIGETKFHGSLKRKEETGLHRLRIGHTHLTHIFLLKGEDKPMCNTCNTFITVEHVLLHCLNYAASRRKYFNCNTLHQLFNSIPEQSIVHFLSEIQILDKL